MEDFDSGTKGSRSRTIGTPALTDNMNPTQALQIINQATQPGARLTRHDYVLVEQAIGVLAQAIQVPLEPVEPDADNDDKEENAG